MKLPRLTAFLAAAATASLAAPSLAKKAPPQQLAADPAAARAYAQVVAAVANMVSDRDARAQVQRHGLQLLNVLWEDTGRWEGSALGPNISDVTIEVEAEGGRRYLMPVIRYDNFTDKTGDVALDKVWVPVGNHAGGKLETISLRDLLANPKRYLSDPKAGAIQGGSLLAERDSHALVSAQHAFLPVPKDGKATFWPVIFNYQSTAKNPAVLTILVTRQGTSMTVIDNERDTVGGGGSWGQRLYFNQDGQRAPLIAERLKDVQGKGKTANGEDAASLGEDANLLMIIQVPLRHKASHRGYWEASIAEDDGAPAPSATGGAGATAKKPADRGRPDVDVAVLGHGPAEGPFTELDGLTIERDPRFPVRVTVQFYQATSNGVMSAGDVERMAGQIANVYEQADYVGSLVVPTPVDRQRPTRWTGASAAPADLDWGHFPGLVARYRKYGWLWIPDVQPEATPAPQPVVGIW